MGEIGVGGEVAVEGWSGGAVVMEYGDGRVEAGVGEGEVSEGRGSERESWCGEGRADRRKDGVLVDLPGLFAGGVSDPPKPHVRTQFMGHPVGVRVEEMKSSVPTTETVSDASLRVSSGRGVSSPSWIQQ